ncbi:tomoregulin-2 isoform X2 [Solea senegalensis]|uniref:Tomoregulin-2 isoform X2 n=1 Tax=Solea senegalensis TaxID=28829 RepID=A0AAV6RC40_SOLSE|nr:tomoregulin-2a [Solea senegalensis]XP_058478683.1 tomoregulin-2a [Solea solea]KAG7503009.1 tomoregulin-2 isoform X2 [Solea senegalensis]
MSVQAAAPAPLAEPRRLRQWSGAAGGWLRITLVSFLATLPVEQLRAFPSSLSDCQTPTGWNCSGFDDRDTDLFLCDTNTCKFDGECLRIGNMVTCICDFKCNNDYTPVCGSNNQNYQNECFLRRDACKQQSEVLIVSEGACPADAGSGSGDDGGEGSAEAGQKETSTCDICQFGAECDVDAEDVWCVCNIDCSHISFNPVCASDGRSYDNPCQVKEASCQKQERIEVKYLGHCQGDIITGNKGGDGHFARTDLTENNEDPRNGLARGLYIPCPDDYKNYCVHGECQFPSILAKPSCSCHSGFQGPQCDIKEYNVLYVVPGSGKLHYVLIASIIGALQVVIICVVVLCITRKCPRTNRINRQKQNNVHFSSENTMRASTRLI